MNQNARLVVTTDNWLLQDAVASVSSDNDPTDGAAWVSINESGLDFNRTQIGVFQLECLGSLLEQLVLCDEIWVLEEWMDVWLSRSKTMGSFVANQVIRPIKRGEETLSVSRARYLDEFGRHGGIRAASSSPAQVPTVNQVVAGTASYLALSEWLGKPYSPHPVRGRMLKQTLWHPAWPDPGVSKMNDLVHSSHVRLQEVIGPGSSLATLSCRLPPIALLCLRDSTAQLSALEVAAQLRDASGMANLRAELGNISAAFAAGDTQASLKHSRRLEAGIKEAERQLGIRDLADPASPTQVHAFSLPIRVPAALQRPLVTPRHTGILHRIVSGSTAELDKLLAEKLGWRDRRLLEAIHECLGESRTGR